MSAPIFLFLQKSPIIMYRESNTDFCAALAQYGGGITTHGFQLWMAIGHTVLN